MTVALPFTISDWSTAAIFYRQGFGEGSAWLPLRMETPTKPGMSLVRLTRASLPNDEECVFRFTFGVIDGVYYEPPDLAEYTYIKVTLDDVTAWVGVVLAMRDTLIPGASDRRIGAREYHCAGMLALLRTWTLDRYQSYEIAGRSSEHPGYNVSGLQDWSDADPGGLGYDAHAYPNGDNAAGFWTDERVIRHALLANNRPTVAAFLPPTITVAGTANELSRLQSWREWPVSDGESVASLLLRVLNRSRGVGVSYFTYDTDGNTIYLAVKPEFTTNVTDGTHTIYGAGANAITVDLQGDHRLGEDGPSRFELSEIADQAYDAVDCFGERIQVLAILDDRAAGTPTLAKRWTAAQQTAFDALADPAAADPKLDSVYRVFGTTIGAAPISGGDGEDGTRNSRLDYQSDDAGVILAPQADDKAPAQSCNILDDLPLLAGWDYSVDPPVKSGDAPQGEPVRLPIRIFDITAPTAWVDLTNAPGVTVTRVGPDIRLDIVGDDRIGVAHPKIAVLCAIELPYRLRVRRYAPNRGPNNTRRVKRIYVPGAHMHLAHHGSVYGINASGVPQRFTGATANLPRTLRNDQDTLDIIALRAQAYYLRRRRTCSWSLRACGLNAGWRKDDGNGGDGALQVWPRLGEVVTTVAAGGSTHTVDTPITSITYDHESGITTWTTGWTDRDWSSE